MLLEDGPLFFVGIDWAAAEHAVCVLDQAGRRVGAFTVEHTADGFAMLARRLGKLGGAERVPVAIERPDGRLVDALLAAGHPVMPVKPNAIKTWREAEVLSGAKSDPGDAMVIADYLRVRIHRLRPATPYSGATKGLRTVVRTRGDLVDARVAATNQLAALLDMHWPGAKAIFADVESPIALKVLTRYPTPASAARLGEKRTGAVRAANGRAEPWKVKFLGIGNENWGCGGNMRPEHYADLLTFLDAIKGQYSVQGGRILFRDPNDLQVFRRDISLINADYVAMNYFHRQRLAIIQHAMTKLKEAKANH